ncbi:MAG: AAA family ATPase, partial [Chloroflexota bacterium]
MYTKFKIQNFRIFNEFKLADLKRVNLFSGKNSSGKTSLLHAILIHAGQCNGLYTGLKPFDLPSQLATDTRMYSSLSSKYNVPFAFFHHFNDEQQIIFRAEGDLSYTSLRVDELRIAREPVHKIDVNSLESNHFTQPDQIVEAV